LTELDNIIPSSILNLEEQLFNNLFFDLDFENPYLPVVIDHNTIYFIDVRKNNICFFLFLFKFNYFYFKELYAFESIFINN